MTDRNVFEEPSVKSGRELFNADLQFHLNNIKDGNLDKLIDKYAMQYFSRRPDTHDGVARSNIEAYKIYLAHQILLYRSYMSTQAGYSDDKARFCRSVSKLYHELLYDGDIDPYICGDDDDEEPEITSRQNGKWFNQAVSRAADITRALLSRKS